MIVCELLYLFLVAERTGGTSVLGVLADGACAAVVAWLRILQEHIHGAGHEGGNRFVVIGVVSAGVTALAVLAVPVFVRRGMQYAEGPVRRGTAVLRSR
ncbi:hypothetical protein [Nonomuraea fuscirosea]|uniref:hypothetical protein n=1 Tax=Nonomuraea fuscirosea TaxID=1291556 RepID=UPI0033D4F554